MLYTEHSHNVFNQCYFNKEKSFEQQKKKKQFFCEISNKALLF